MTNDFKKKILDWLSGNYAIQSGSNVPQFSDVYNYTNDLEIDLEENFPYGYYFTDSLQAYDTITLNGLKYTIAYGQYRPTSSSSWDDTKGFISILDDKFNLLQCITQYSSGTQFGEFEKINVGDDGNFFAIEKVDNTKRFVMMNNIIAKFPNEDNYKVVLKKAYNLQGASANIETFSILIKAPGQSRYLIGGSEFYSENLVATELVINVGTSNEWNDYQYTSPPNNDFTMSDVYANWNYSTGHLEFKIAGINDDLGSSPGRTKYGELIGNSDNVGTLTLTLYGTGFDESLVHGRTDVKIINSNESYIMVRIEEEYPSTTNYMEIYHFKNGNITQIYKKKTADYDPMHPDPYTNPLLVKIKNEIFYLSQYINENNKYVLEVGKIIDNDVYSKIVKESDNENEYMFFTVQKQFDLYNYYVQFENTVAKVDQIYSQYSYNGVEYQDLNSMVPDHVNLYNNSNLIFSRNLYNLVINDNTTVATVKIPNNYQNDVVINKQELYGETKTKLVESTQSITKNIYEEVLLNFVNSLFIKNKNDINNIIDNYTGATRLNNSISSWQLLDYDNCKITKYRINYDDNTSEVRVLTNFNVSYEASKTVYTFSFYNNISNIQLISNDENTIYQTIDLSNLEKGKYYVITQDLHIN
jgi:hypothetical protein